MWLEDWIFQSHPFTFRERRVAEGSFTNVSLFIQSCLHNKASTKTQKDRSGELLSWWTYADVGRVVHPETAWKLCAPSHIYLTLCISHLAIPDLNLLIITNNLVSTLFSWNLWASLAINWPRGGGHGTSDLQPIDQKHRWQPDWQLTCEGGGDSLVGLSP